MSSLKADPAQLLRLKQARIERGWAIDDTRWLIEASNILQPGIDWSRAEKFAVSIGTWKQFLRGQGIRPLSYKAFCQVLGVDWQETIATVAQTVKSCNKCAWGEIPDSSMLVGRSAEMATLRQWIEIDRVRLIPILGMGGVGKTALAAQLAQGIAGEFEYVIWSSLREAPPVEQIDRKSTRLNSSHRNTSRMPSSA